MGWFITLIYAGGVRKRTGERFEDLGAAASSALKLADRLGIEPRPAKDPPLKVQIETAEHVVLSITIFEGGLIPRKDNL